MHPVGIVYHPLYAQHDTGTHPENADRVRRTIEHLTKLQYYGEARKSGYHAITPVPATIDQLAWGHSPDFIAHVQHTIDQVIQSGHMSFLDGIGYGSGETVASPRSWDAALAAVGGNFTVLDAIMAGTVRRGFVLCRPPGHHSNVSMARGFCIFNNIYLAAEYLFRQHGLRKVAIVDFDAHAGNGTEEILNSRGASGELLFFSLHQHPRTLYPGTCYAEEIGEGAQTGKIVNLTLYPYSGQHTLKILFDRIITPMLQEFGPEFILISAGFDAHHLDPLTALGFMDQTYPFILQQLLPIADQTAAGRISCTLEGGYHLQAIARSIGNTIATLAEDVPPHTEASEFDEDTTAIEYARNTLIPTLHRVLAPHWRCFRSSSPDS